MYVLFTGGKAYSGGGWVGGWVCVGGGGAVADPDLQIRGGEFIQSMRKQGAISKKSFSAPVWSKNKWGGGGAGGARAPPLGPPLGDVITGSSR